MRSWRVVTAGCVTAAVIIGWLSLEKGLAALYSNMRPKLELRSRDVLGRPVELGSFQGLSWQGFHIGPSRVLASTNDQSQLKIEGLIVSWNTLLASLQQCRWVAHLHVLDLHGDLRRNAQGSFWTIEQGESQNPMPAEIWLHTQGPAQFKIWLEPESEQQYDLALTLEGRVALGHARHGTIAEGEALFHNSGRLSFEIQGTPLSQTWKIHGETDDLQLDVFRPLLVDSPWQGLSGQVDGDVTLHWTKDRSCRGDLNLEAKALSGLDWVEELGIEEMGIDVPKLHCDGDYIQMANSSVHIGELTGQVQGFLDLDGDVDLNASLMGPFPPVLDPVIAGGELNSELHLFGPVTALEGQINLTIAGWQHRQSTVEAMTPDQPLPPLKAQVQLASEWRSAQDFQLWGSLEAEAGESDLAVTGHLAPNLHLQSTTLKVAPREWLSHSLADALFPPQPYRGHLAVKQTAAGQELDLQLHNNSQLEEPLSLKLACDTLLEPKACETHLTGSLELAAGQLKAEATDDQWQLELSLTKQDLMPVLDMLPKTVRDKFATLSSPPPELTLSARAYGEYDLDDREFLLAGGRLTASLPDGLRVGEDVLLEPDNQLQFVGEQGRWELDVSSRTLRGDGVVHWSPGPSWQEAAFDLNLDIHALPLDAFGLVEVPFAANLDFDGQMNGVLVAGVPEPWWEQLRLNGKLQLDLTPLGPLHHSQTWSGGIHSSSDGHELDLVAKVVDHQLAGVWPPTLQVKLASTWQEAFLNLRAGEGRLKMLVTEDSLDWSAIDFPLTWLKVGQDKSFQAPLLGILNGEGTCSPSCGQLGAKMTIYSPRFGPLQGHQLHLDLDKKDHQWHLAGHFETDEVDPKSDPKSNSPLTVNCQLDQQPGKNQPWSCQADLDQLPLRLLRQGMELAISVGQGARFSSADNLKDIVPECLKKSIGQSEKPIDIPDCSKESVNQSEQSHDWLLRPLQGQVNGDLEIKGAADQPVHVVLGTDLHLWLQEDRSDHNLSAHGKPLRLEFKGPLEGNSKSWFRFSSLPLNLIALVNPQISREWSCISQSRCSDKGEESVVLDILQKFPLQGQLMGHGTVQNLFSPERDIKATLGLQEGQLNSRGISLGWDRDVLEDLQPKERFMKAKEMLRKTLESSRLSDARKKSIKQRLETTETRERKFLESMGLLEEGINLRWKGTTLATNLAFQSMSGEEQDFLEIYGWIRTFNNELKLKFVLTDEALPMILSSSDDDLTFLEHLSDGKVIANKGRAFFQNVIVTGSMKQPMISGDGAVEDFQGSVAGIPINFSGRVKVEPGTNKIIFYSYSKNDTNEPMEIAVGNSGGKIKVSGKLDIRGAEEAEEGKEEQGVTVNIENMRLKNLDVGSFKASFLANGQLELKGSVRPLKIEIGNEKIDKTLELSEARLNHVFDSKSEESERSLGSSTPEIKWLSLKNLKGLM